MNHILIVDDEAGSRESLKAIFSKKYQISLAENAESAMQLLSKNRVDLILLDVLMPNKDGLTFLKDAKNRYPNVPVIMVSASSAVPPVVQAIRNGACDYVTKPFDITELRRLVERALESSVLHRRVEILESEVSQEFPVHGIIGKAPLFKKALEAARKAAEGDSTIVIYGESGTGKELVARLIHTLSKRHNEPFVAVHCASLPETLMESELFGYEKGAFTNADHQKLGRFDLAGSGTLFFDEVSETSLATQVKLLRVLQEREYMRVGGSKIIRTDARIVTASVKDLQAEVDAKRFRDDLFYRLSVIPIQLPPLRDRLEDIPLLTRYFLNYFKQKMPIATHDFDAQAMELLCSYRWPGNIRELRNIIERMLVLHGKKEAISVEDLAPEFQNKGDAPETIGFYSPTPSIKNQNLKLSEALGLYERHLIENAIKEADGVQTKAAKILGTTRRILKYRMEKLSIHPDESS